MDILGQWLSECCETGPEFAMAGYAAYSSYKAWADASGQKPWGGPTFGRKLKERFDAKRDSNGIQYSGFRGKERVSTIVKAQPGLGSDEALLRLDRAPIQAEPVK